MADRPKRADQRPRRDDDGIHWIQATSKNGVPYEIGFRNIEHSEERGVVVTKDYYPKPVNWPVADDSWKETTGEVAQTIRRYNLHRNGGWSIYEYRLDFINKEIRSYRFWDETEDYYDVGTNAIGDHFVRFSSDKPTIKYVT